MKEIKNLINNQTFLVEDPEKDEPISHVDEIGRASTCEIP